MGYFITVFEMLTLDLNMGQYNLILIQDRDIFKDCFAI